MAEENENVQGYLTKHKISSLFEDLMSRVVKELPLDPVDFLIKKLQILQRLKKKKDSSHIPTVSSVKASRGKIQVTGVTVTTPTNSKSPVSDRLSKSTSGLRPLKPKSGLSSFSASSLSKTTPTKTTPTKTTPTGHGAVRSSSGSVARSSSKLPTPSGVKSKPVAKPGSRIPSAGSKRTPSRPTTAPVSVGKLSITTPTNSSAPKKALALGVGKKPSAPSAERTSTKHPPSSGPSPTSVIKNTADNVAEVRSEQPISSVSTHKREAKVEEVDEFFGAARKSSQKHFFVDSEEEESSDLGVESDGDSDEVVLLVDQGRHAGTARGIDIQDIVEKRRYKHKRAQKKDLQLLVSASVSKSSTPLSLGYHDDTESGDSDAGLELLEDADTLRDEGVEVTQGGNYAMKIIPEPQETAICARCARALGKGTSTVTDLDFESVSQVGSHASYPQWGSEALGSSLAEHLGSNERDLETSSDVTLESHDTWGGLAPPAASHPQLSDEESEVQLPPPAPLQGHVSWLPQTAPQGTTHGWDQQT